MRILASFHVYDGQKARRFIEECRSRGIDATNKDLKLATHGKADVQEQLIREIRDYDLVVLFWSKHYEQDDFLQMELFALLTVQRERLQPFVVPVLIEEVALPATLKSFDTFALDGDFDERLSNLVDSLPQHNSLFVVMMFGNSDLDSTYQLAMKSSAEELGFDVTRIDEVENSESITQQILKYIEGAAVVLCDLTGPRPNVYFETGYALALRKDVILTAKDGSEIHFDLKDRKIIFWSTAADLKTKLSARLASILQRRLT